MTLNLTISLNTVDPKFMVVVHILQLFYQPLHDREMEPLHKMLKHEMHTKDNCVHFVNLESLQWCVTISRTEIIPSTIEYHKDLPQMIHKQCSESHACIKLFFTQIWRMEIKSRKQLLQQRKKVDLNHSKWLLLQLT